MPSSTIDHVDVLIVGAGPAGLMAANWLAHMGVKTRIVDKRSTKIFNGQADGVHLRTIEVFDSFDVGDRLLREANPICEMNIWFPDNDGNIKRGQGVVMGKENLSRYKTLIVLHQGRIERFLLDKIKEVSDIKVERGSMPVSLDYDTTQAEDPEAYPVTVQLQHLSQAEATPAQNLTSVPDGLFRSNLSPDDTDDLIRENSGKEGSTETIKAKYVIGCDGAHSWVRRQLGYKLDGDATDYIWGVLDILPKTDFPDIRTGATIKSADHGSILLIPRERGLVRLYIQLNQVVPGADGRADRSKITPEVLLETARKIMTPYKIDYEYCDWWTAYQVGQRFGKNYSKDNRIFLAGDACHTHSPKAGQGMNVSMQDTYNLGWKLGLVAKGMAPRTILGTYQSERSWVAEKLIDLDHKMSRMMSVKPNTASDGSHLEGQISMEEMRSTVYESELFQTGTAIEYGHSMLVAKSGKGEAIPNGDGVVTNDITPIGKQELATGVLLGRRIPSYKVLNQADGMRRHVAEALKSDGRFRVVLFAGNLKDEAQMLRVKQFCEKLDDKSSFMHRYNRAGDSPNPTIQILTIHSSARTDLGLNDLPGALRPYHQQRGYDYNTIFADCESARFKHGQAYRQYGIDSTRGCVVVVRPDQHVGYIGELEDTQDLESYFSAILLPAEQHKSLLTFVDREKVLGGVSARAGNHADL